MRGAPFFLCLIVCLLGLTSTASAASDLTSMPIQWQRRSSLPRARPWRKGWDAFFEPGNLPLPHGGWGWGRK